MLLCTPISVLRKSLPLSVNLVGEVDVATPMPVRVPLPHRAQA